MAMKTQPHTPTVITFPLPAHLPPSQEKTPPFSFFDETVSVSEIGGWRRCAPADVEHVLVEDDPRKWTPFHKNLSMALIASASMISGLAANIQNPAVKQMETELPATSSQFSLSLSLFMLLQGCIPLLWSTVSEVKGRKLVYISSLSLFTLGAVAAGLSHNIQFIIASRCLQAVGSSAVMSIGAASLADIFDPAERGRKMGIYYIAPLLGPALGPIVGGVLTTEFDWRAIFWFLAAVAGTSMLSFLFFFKDTFRPERSLIYQNAARRRLMDGTYKVETHNSKRLTSAASMDVEKVPSQPESMLSSAISSVQLSVTDVNPIKPIFHVLKRKNNLMVLIPSGLLFAYGLLVAYTCSRTLSNDYGYNPTKIGLVVLCYGVGCVFGSVLGGRWSDRQLAKARAVNPLACSPETRLRSTLLGVVGLPLSVLAYGWVCEKRLHVSAICVTLFMSGFFNIWIYSSTLAYIVDSNNGRSATAAAVNSVFRGASAFIATELAVPFQTRLGDGWTFTIWAIVMLFTGLLVLVAWGFGQSWREGAEEREMREVDEANKAILRLGDQGKN